MTASGPGVLQRNARILAAIAAAMALAAAVLRWTAERKLDWISLIGGVAMAVFAFGYGRKPR